MDDETSYHLQRRRMVEDQIVRRGIRDERVLAALLAVPRHCFVPVDQRDLAYEDCPLPIGYGQTISQPYIVALMTQLLELKGEETVLEIGTGSGYQAAVLAHLARQVHTIERLAPLAETARQALLELGLANVHVHVGDGSAGLPQFAPFDAILMTAAAPRLPPPLREQLTDGGRLVLPVGGLGEQRLELWQRRGELWDHEMILPVAFVPLRGKHGWSEDDSRWRE